ncbi:peptidylprolyl isomerase [candidate division KSB1 bacterium]
MGLMNQMRDKMHYMLIILVIAFMGTIVFDWGMNYMGTKGGGSGARGVVGSINGKDISYDQFFQQIQQEYMRIKEITGTEPNEMRIKQAWDEVWQRIVNQTLIQEEIQRLNISISDEEIVYIIKNNPPEFLRMNPKFLTDEKFDQNKYQQALINPAVDWSEIENYIRIVKPSQKIQNLISSTARVTSKEIEKQIVLAGTKGQADYIVSKPSDFSNVAVNVTNDEIKSYFNAHKEDFIEQEKCKLKYAAFRVTTTQEDTQSVLEDAQSLIERIKSGEDFSKLAEEYSHDPTADKGGDLGYFSKGDMVKEFEEASFSAKKGDVIGPVKTAFGYHIIKIADIKNRRRGKVDSVRASHILLKVEPSMETVNNAKYAAEDFSEEAKSSGFEKTAAEGSLEILETTYFNNTGFIPGIGMLNSAARFAFKGNVGDISEPLGTEDVSYVFMISEKVPERTMPLADVRETIENKLAQNKRKDIAKDKIQKVYNDIQAGKPFMLVSNENSMIVESTGEFGYFDYITNIGNDTKFTTAALKMNPGEISEPVESTGGWYLINLTEKTTSDTTMTDERKAQLYWNILETQKQTVFTAWLDNLRKKADIKDFREKYF